MEPAWWHALGKDNRGSRPRCVLLVEGAPDMVAGRLTELVGLSEMTVAPTDRWMPYGKPILTTAGQWNKAPADEARLDRHDGFVSPEAQQQLRDWWLASNGRPSTPNWDLVSTCHIDGKKGLLLVEAKAHAAELSTDGKRPPKPRSANSKANHQRIGEAIQQANAGLRYVTGGSWNLSRDHHYQVCNRFAWSWKLATLGMPTVLVYLGFLNADDMTPPDARFRSQDDWARILKYHVRGVVDDSCWENRLDVDGTLCGGTPFWPLIRAIDLPFVR